MFTVVPSLERDNNGDNYYRITVYITRGRTAASDRHQSFEHFTFRSVRL